MNVVDVDTVTVHLTRSAAIAGSSAINLTTSGSETQSLYSSKAAIFNDSGGAITINVGGGGSTPSIRNGSGASATVANTVTVTIKTVDKALETDIQNVNVSVYKQSDDTEIFIPTLTDVNGEVSFGFDPGVSTDIYIIARKGTSSPKYVRERVIGTIFQGVDFNLTILLTPDDIVG